MKVNDTLADTTRAAHDVGLAAWLGGAMFGKLAHNPSLVQRDDRDGGREQRRFERDADRKRSNGRDGTTVGSREAVRG